MATLSPPRARNRRWTAAEVESLRAGYGLVPTVQLAGQLGRTPHATTLKALALGLDGDPPPSRQEIAARHAAVRAAKQLKYRLGRGANLLPAELDALLGPPPARRPRPQPGRAAP